MLRAMSKPRINDPSLSTSLFNLVYKVFYVATLPTWCTLKLTMELSFIYYSIAVLNYVLSSGVGFN